jgi:hypothetical protein
MSLFLFIFYVLNEVSRIKNLDFDMAYYETAPYDSEG